MAASPCRAATAVSLYHRCTCLPCGSLFREGPIFICASYLWGFQMRIVSFTDRGPCMQELLNSRISQADAKRRRSTPVKSLATQPASTSVWASFLPGQAPTATRPVGSSKSEAAEQPAATPRAAHLQAAVQMQNTGAEDLEDQPLLKRRASLPRNPLSAAQQQQQQAAPVFPPLQQQQPICSLPPTQGVTPQRPQPFAPPTGSRGHPLGPLASGTEAENLPLSARLPRHRSSGQRSPWPPQQQTQVHPQHQAQVPHQSSRMPRHVGQGGPPQPAAGWGGTTSQLSDGDAAAPAEPVPAQQQLQPGARPGQSQHRLPPASVRQQIAAGPSTAAATTSAQPQLQKAPQHPFAAATPAGVALRVLQPMPPPPPVQASGVFADEDDDDGDAFEGWDMPQPQQGQLMAATSAGPASAHQPTQVAAGQSQLQQHAQSAMLAPTPYALQQLQQHHSGGAQPAVAAQSAPMQQAPQQATQHAVQAAAEVSQMPPPPPRPHRTPTAAAHGSDPACDDECPSTGTADIAELLSLYHAIPEHSGMCFLQTRKTHVALVLGDSTSVPLSQGPASFERDGRRQRCRTHQMDRHLSRPRPLQACAARRWADVLL